MHRGTRFTCTSDHKYRVGIIQTKQKVAKRTSHHYTEWEMSSFTSIVTLRSERSQLESCRAGYIWNSRRSGCGSRRHIVGIATECWKYFSVVYSVCGGFTFWCESIIWSIGSMASKFDSVHAVIVDWGTTNMRATIVDNLGVALDTKTSTKGLLYVAKQVLWCPHKSYILCIAVAGVVPVCNGCTNATLNDILGHVTYCTNTSWMLSICDEMWDSSHVLCGVIAAPYGKKRREVNLCNVCFCVAYSDGRVVNPR